MNSGDIVQHLLVQWQKMVARHNNIIYKGFHTLRSHSTQYIVLRYKVKMKKKKKNKLKKSFSSDDDNDGWWVMVDG